MRPAADVQGFTVAQTLLTVHTADIETHPSSSAAAVRPTTSWAPAAVAMGAPPSPVGGATGLR